MDMRNALKAVINAHRLDSAMPAPKHMKESELVNTLTPFQKHYSLIL